MCISCGEKDENLCCMNDSYQYLLWLGFHDTSGNDLLEGTESIWHDGKSTTKPEYYTLDILYAKGNANSEYPRIYLFEGWLPSPDISNLVYSKYLMLEAVGERETSNFSEKIIFRLTCPYLFGDNETHDIVTLWKLEKNDRHPKCYLVEFDNKEFSVENMVMKDANGIVEVMKYPAATIILNK